MPLSIGYERYFIILNEEEKGYKISGSRSPTGYVSVEKRGNKVKIKGVIQNIKTGEKSDYRLFLIAPTNYNAMEIGRLRMENEKGEIFSELTLAESKGTYGYTSALVAAGSSIVLFGSADKEIEKADLLEWFYKKHIRKEEDREVEIEERIVIEEVPEEAEELAERIVIEEVPEEIEEVAERIVIEEAPAEAVEIEERIVVEEVPVEIEEMEDREELDEKSEERTMIEEAPEEVEEVEERIVIEEAPEEVEEVEERIVIEEAPEEVEEVEERIVIEEAPEEIETEEKIDRIETDEKLGDIEEIRIDRLVMEEAPEEIVEILERIVVEEVLKEAEEAPKEAEEEVKQGQCMEKKEEKTKEEEGEFFTGEGSRQFVEPIFTHRFHQIDLDYAEGEYQREEIEDKIVVHEEKTATKEYPEIAELLNNLRKTDGIEGMDNLSWFGVDNKLKLFDNITVNINDTKMPLSYPYFAKGRGHWVNDGLLGVEYKRDQIKKLYIGLPGIYISQWESYFRAKGFAKHGRNIKTGKGYWVMCIDLDKGDISDSF